MADRFLRHLRIASLHHSSGSVPTTGRHRRVVAAALVAQLLGGVIVCRFRCRCLLAITVGHCSSRRLIGPR